MHFPAQLSFFANDQYLLPNPVFPYCELAASLSRRAKRYTEATQSFVCRSLQSGSQLLSQPYKRISSRAAHL